MTAQWRRFWRGTFWNRLRRGTFWNRLRRLWHEPRIRLPHRELRPEVLHPGDRLQIGSRLWRIESRPDATAAIGLVAAEGPSDRAWLRLVAGRWMVEAETGEPRGVEIDAASVIHFAVSPDRAS